MRAIIGCAAASILFVSAPTGANSNTFYVSTQGRDSWSGRLSAPNPSRTDGPFASLERARNAIRELKKTGLKKPVTVLINPGTYYLTETLTFTPEDSGTPLGPITYRAAKAGTAVISGGQVLKGVQKVYGERRVIEIPEAAEGRWKFRTLRIGDRWGIRARYPNFDPKDKYKGKWLFADFPGNPWEYGIFGEGVWRIQNPGDSITWEIISPRAGKYKVWVRYGHNMKKFGGDDMSGMTSLRVNDGPAVPMADLPDTGSWALARWANTCTLDIPEGRFRLTWHNDKGGGLNLDAFILTTDTDWNPSDSVKQPTWWGQPSIKPVASGHHLLLVQAESGKLATKEGEAWKGDCSGVNDRLRYRPGDIPNWLDMPQAEIHVFAAWGWLNAILPIGAADHQERYLSFQQPATQDIRKGNRYFIENVREALDAEGEWYLDWKTGKLELIYSGGQRELVAPKLHRLIDFKGEGNRFVERISFEGLTFMDCEYTPARDYYTPGDAAIWMHRTRFCALNDCRFRWLGGYALRIEQSSQDNSFTSNVVEDLGEGGVLLLGPDENIPRKNLIAGNTFRRLGLIQKHVAAVYCTCSSGNAIVHNDISDMPRYAVGLKSFTERYESRDNIVEYNDIRRVNLETNDTGAIEMFCGNMEYESNNIIRHNIILDSVGVKSTAEGELISPCISWGVYLDNNTSGTTVYGNIIVRNDWGGVCIHNGRNNTIENNIFVDGNKQQLRLQPLSGKYMAGNKFTRNIVCFSNPLADLVYSYPNSWSRDRLSECDDNLYWCTGADLNTSTRPYTPEGAISDWKKAGYDSRSLIADPLFVNPAIDDYRLKPSSPAFRLGFKPIPIEKIGARGWKKSKFYKKQDMNN